MFSIDDGLGLAELLADLEQAPYLYRLSPFWERLAAVHIQQLQEGGFNNFKRTVSLKYFHFSLLGIVRHELHPVLWTWLKKPCLEVFKANLPHARSSQQGIRSFTAFENFFYRTWVALLRDSVSNVDSLGLLDSICEPGIGNPFRIHYRGQWTSEDLCNAVHEFYSTCSEVFVDGCQLDVAELGAGYGRLAYVFLKALRSATYTIIDVPPAICIAQRYLSEVFPYERIFHYRRFSNFADVKAEFEASRIRFLAAHQIELLPDKLFDLLINISSLHEMTMNQIRNYLCQIDRVCRGQFYTKQWKVSRAAENGFVIRETEYPIPSGWERIYHRQHPLQRMFFEALYLVGGDSRASQSHGKSLSQFGRGEMPSPMGTSLHLRCRVCCSLDPRVAIAHARDYISEEAFQVWRCGTCGVGFTTPSPLSMERFYPIHYRRYGTFTRSILRFFYRRRVFSWVESGGAPGMALEVGLGPGWMLSALRKRGWKVIGTERILQSISHLRGEDSLPVFIGGLEAIKAVQRFDLIILFHVLEHLSDPVEVIKRCADLLKPGGTLVVSVPNFDSWQARIAKEKWYHLDVPRHLYHFSPQSLTSLLRGAGFEVRKTSFISLEHDPYGWEQSCLNLLGFKHNLLTKILMGTERRSVLSLSGFAMGIVLVFLLFPSLLLSLASWFASAGATVEILAVKSGESSATTATINW